MDLLETFPNEGEIGQIAKAEECGPSKLLLRVVRERRDKLVLELQKGITTLPEQELRAKGGMAASLTQILDMVEKAKQWVLDAPKET